MINKRYVKNKKNKGIVPNMLDQRERYVPVGCGKCIQCRKQRAMSWRIRLSEEIKGEKYCYFVTLTYNEDSLTKLTDKYKTPEEIYKKSVRLFLERWRKLNKKSLRHFFVNELGQTNTERLHIHGIIIANNKITNDYLQQIWSYGYTDIGTYVNEKSINYITKYITKVDIKHKDFKPIVLCSPGIGAKYINNAIRSQHIFADVNTRDYYINNQGYKLAMPLYYKNKLYTEKERQKLWINKMNEDFIYINGIKVNKNDTEYIYKLYQLEQQNNKQLGYG